MIYQPCSRAAFAALLCLATFTPGYPAGAAQIHVGQQILVSAANADREHYEMIGAVDPNDSHHMLACSTVFSSKLSARSNIIYASFDGGVSWAPTLEDTATPFTGDPACAFASSGVAYYAGLPIYGGPHLTSALHIFQSNDYGKSWHVIASRSFMDREYISVDHTQSKYRGNVYMYADGIDSRNGKRSGGFDLERIVNGSLVPSTRSPDSHRWDAMNASEGAIALDGTLVIPFEAPIGETWSERVMRSTDGGKTLMRSTEVGQLCKVFGLGSPAAVDRSDGPFRGRLYMAFEADNEGHCALNILHSDDSGKTWSKAAAIREVGYGPGFRAPDEHQAALAVNDRGIVAISWYDTRDDSTGKAYKLRFSASYDGGESFVPSVAVSPFFENIVASRARIFDAYAGVGGASASRSPAVNDPLVSSVGPDWNTERLPGDTRSMLADSDGNFHPFWYDNHTGLPQLYTSVIEVTGHSWRNGDASLEGFSDATKRVTYRYTLTHFDPDTRRVTLGVELVNRTDTPIHGPVKMRMLWAASKFGIPLALNAANGMQGPGGIWDFSEALDGGVLAPWSASRPITLSFVVRHADIQRVSFPLMEFSSRVYSH